MYIVIIYLILARLCKIFVKNIPLHSLIHCVTAFMFSTCSFIVLGINPFSFSAWKQFTNYDVFDVIVYHSLGYFIADTIDICIDYTNTKRRMSLIHHVVSIVGLSLGGPITVYSIWILEMGGILHHLKHISEVYHLKHDDAIQITYYVVYPFSRILLSVNAYNYTGSDALVIKSLAFVLLVQNFAWWLHNLKKATALKQPNT